MSSRGVTHFRNLVRNKIDAKLTFLRQAANISDANTPDSYVPNTNIAGIIPFMAKPAGAAASGLTNLHTAQIGRLRRQWGTDMLSNVGKHMSGVAEAMDSGWPVWNTYARNATPAVRAMMTRICREIEGRI